jgi:hypothetical protein
MRQHNQEECQIFQRAPGERGVPALASLEFNCRHDKPGPMQKYIDSGETKKMERA